jgi:hypothetical protein
MQTDPCKRVLDLDLDFFLREVADSRPFRGARLDPKGYPPWELADVIAFLEERCGLECRLPGRAVEHHAEVFGLWREGLVRGSLSPAFHVTHIDAHADLGMSEGGYKYLLCELVHLPLRERWHPRESTVGEDEAMTDGNYLAFAAACRWLAGITYVHPQDHGADVHPYIMEGFDPRTCTIRMPRLRRDELTDRGFFIPPGSLMLPPERLEPPVPLHSISAREYRADAPFDFVFLARSPTYTPSEADPIHEAIRERFIDEPAWDQRTGTAVGEKLGEGTSA